MTTGEKKKVSVGSPALELGDYQTDTNSIKLQFKKLLEQVVSSNPVSKMFLVQQRM